MASSRAGNIDKAIATIQSLIAQGEFFDAQQKTRTVVARQTKAKNWDAAIDVLFNVSQTLLKAGKGGEAGDLGVLLVDVYKQAELRPDATSKGRLLTLLRMFKGDEPTRKKYIGEMIGWSKSAGYPLGDPELHHIAGSLYADEYKTDGAEHHLLLGTRESPEVLARLEYAWYRQDAAPHTAPLYVFRPVLNYLILGNVRAANAAYRTFVGALWDENGAGAGLAAQQISSASADLRVFPSLPLLNFLGMVLLLVRRGSPELYRQLRAKYAAHVTELAGQAWDDAFDLIAEMYFGIQKPRQSNPLLDMMGSLLGGGGAGGAAGGARRPPARRVEAPAAEGLD